MTIGPFQCCGASDTPDAMIIFGWLRPFTILGLKLDECANCGQVCNHFVGRRVNGAAAPSPGSTAHQCWEAPDESITGCLMADGTVDGETSDSPITCYFNEPLPSGDGRLMCRHAEPSMTAAP
jgi:hypothetical protein